MLLRNYDNIKTARNLLVIGQETVSTDTTNFGDEHINGKTYGGGLATLVRASDWKHEPLSYFTLQDNNATSLQYGSSNLIIGGDNNPVTYDDYKLNQLFTSTQVTKLNHLIKTKNYWDKNENAWITTYSKTYLANEDITIKEIGVASGIYYRTGTGYYDQVLVYREVLEIPIEVPANANVVITFTTKVFANPNKPADYVATASVE